MSQAPHHSSGFREDVLILGTQIKNLSVSALHQRSAEDGALRLRLYRVADEANRLLEYVNRKDFHSNTINYKIDQIAGFEMRLSLGIKAIEDYTLRKKPGSNFRRIAKLLDTANELSNYLKAYRESLDASSRVMDEHYPTLSIPTEIPAPIRIAVSEERISLTAPKHKSGQLTDKSIDNFRRSACEILTELIDELSQPTSNADRRLNPRLKSLLRELSVPLPNMAVEAVGLQWQVTSDVIAATHETVPDALLPQIQRILSTIRNLLGQFDEWHEYEAVTIAETIKPEDTQDLAKIGDEIATEIASKCEVIDSQIGDRLHDMALALSEGLVKRETLAAPIVGSLSNFFAGISQFILERGSFIINPAIEIGMTATDPITLGRSVILLSVCAYILNKFAPRLMEYAPFSWLKTIQPTALKYYSALSKTGKG